MEHMPGDHYERRYSHYEQLRQMLSAVAQQVNSDLAERYGMQQPLVDESCTVTPEAFAGRPSFSQQELEADRATIGESVRKWSDADNPRVQAFYSSRYGGATPQAVMEWYMEEQRRSPSGQLEMLVPLLFHRAFGDDFLVVRANAYDDYFHGVDTVVVNKATGETVCALDEVHEHGGSDRKDMKMAKVKRTVAHNGTSFRYGVSIHEGKLDLGPVHHLPVFFLGLSSKQLEAALAELAGAGVPTQAEKQLCGQLVDSLAAQVTQLQSERPPREVAANLERARQAIALMQNRCRGGGESPA